MHARIFVVSLAVALGVAGSGCLSDAETPNANYGTAAVPGTLNNPCTSSNACRDDNLACIDTEGTGLAEPTCLKLCAQNGNDCDDGYRCVSLAGSPTDGVCIAVSSAGGPCGVCGEGLTCTGQVCLIDCDADGAACSEGACQSVDGGPSVCVP